MTLSHMGIVIAGISLLLRGLFGLVGGVEFDLDWLILIAGIGLVIWVIGALIPVRRFAIGASTLGGIIAAISLLLAGISGLVVGGIGIDQNWFFIATGIGLLMWLFL